MELYVNGKITKNLYVGWMKKVQVTGEQYNYQFLSDLTGTNRNDLVKIIRPGSGPKSSHTVDLKEGDDVLVLTENLMDVYSIKSGILHYHGNFRVCCCTNKETPLNFMQKHLEVSKMCMFKRFVF